MLYSNKKLLVVVLVVLAIFVTSFGVGAVSADELGSVHEGSACRRSDAPCGATWQNGRWVDLPGGGRVFIFDCVATPCDAFRVGSGGYVYATHHRWGLVYGRNTFGRAQIGFSGVTPEGWYREYRAWMTFPLGGLPEQGVAKAAIVLEADTQWLATDENTSLVVELIDIGSWQPRVYYELDYPPTKAELLRLTAGEIKEMVEYYNEPLRIGIPPALLEERIARAQQNPKWSLGLRLRFEGAPTNNVLIVEGGRLYIRWAD